jgi:short-subunit dehydrogenase
MPPNNRSKDKNVLLTGASSGIGYELAKLFARDGYNLILVARTEEKLNRLAAELRDQYKINVMVLPKDLSSPDAPREIYDQLQKESVQVDILVNNAGFAVYGPFAETDMEEELNMIRVNMMALTRMAKLFLPGMIERRHGKILNVASSAGFVSGPYASVYYASKAYVISMSGALSEELRGTGVTVTALCPGPVRTEFFKRAGMMGTPLQGLFAKDPDVVARVGYRALMKGRRAVIVGLFYKLLIGSTRLIPRTLATKISKLMLASKK